MSVSERYLRYRDIDLDLDMRHGRTHREIDVLDRLLERERDCNRCTSDSRPADNTRDILDRLLF